MATASVSKQGYSVKELAAQLQKSIQAQVNGQLTIKAHDGTMWNLYFRVGRLFWASGGKHPYRRWRRLLKQFCSLTPDAIQAREQELSAVPEHWLLNILIKRQQTGRKEAGSLVAQTLLDVLFDILLAAEQIQQISALGDAAVEKEEPIAILSTAELLTKSQALLGEWFNLGLIAYSPDLAPRVLDVVALQQQVSPKLAQALHSLATGKASIRELAVITRQNPMALGKLLAPSIQKNLIKLSEIPDIPSAYTRNKELHRDERRADPLKVRKDKPTILCVDDSAQIAYILEQILQPAGYHFVSVQDSVEALSAILKHKPDLIFLDLMMPLVFGNEICTQVRRAPAFRETPIIILSSNARMLDRIQAKGAGATEFMAKPLEPAKVISMVRRHLGELPALCVEAV
ncbi:MAG: response regulator [Synechococcales cyanobacterium RU_4_20]|nr:response regulator [Synechococcales cyanobacterium RU_4_20]NJR68717.1 response regulator [Synechococcales cyanobacterium CRU_2_2]